MTTPWVWGVVLLGSLTVLAAPKTSAEKPQPSLEKRGPSVVVQGEHIVHLSGEGKVHAWRLGDLGADPDYARALASQRMLLLATGGGQLWGTDLARVYRWSEKERAWTSEGSLPARKEAAIDLAVVGDRPVVVYTSSVVEALTGKVHPLSKLKNAFAKGFRALAVHASGTHVWVGTGYGEWGGCLFGLDLKSGQWAQSKDSLHYVTGISGDGKGNLWVSWSMSHFMANTLLRVHRLDATVAKEYPELKSKYIQTVAWDDARKVLYGIEQNSLVRFEEGKPVELSALGQLPYAQEPNAIGVSPGMIRLEVIGPERLLLVHESRAPFVYADGKLVTLSLE
ncbi:hypothetical protein POL68_11480 [Stigmatella sp. ncwal1]|uniref:Uncharacterized protein n=1 Tax=Stigmatella ashevillensis TaxID=2995309 RepID=A0ABT5D5Y7_9BACT|nr:hypothetical protein [Stigmatella ashevillena]MDC0709084.1 hypothetical protein [Stigmatella ashevillena]